MADMDSLAKTFELMGNYKERFAEAGIPKDLWYLTEDMECQNVLTSFTMRGTGEIIEDRCLKLLRNHPRTEEYLSAHGYQFYDIETGEMVSVKQAAFCNCDAIIQQKQLLDKYDTIRRYRDAGLPQVVRGKIPRSSINATFENFAEPSRVRGGVRGGIGLHRRERSVHPGVHRWDRHRQDPLT